MMNKVCVFMSTFNGEKFIKEQLDSLISQVNIQLFLKIRDDGSTDNTLLILQEYKERYPDMIEYYSGSNIGFANSFYELMCRYSGYDYYAFSDQDDIWNENKIIKAIEKIKNQIRPMLYGSNLKAFNSNDNTKYYIYNTKDKEKILTNMKNYPFISNPYGCTMLWNNALHIELLKYEKPTLLTHDVWVNLLGAYLGNVYFDFNSYINYRIHLNNACGVTPISILGKIKKYYKFYYVMKKTLGIEEVCKTITNIFPDNVDTTIVCFSNYKKNILCIFKALLSVINMKVSIKAKLKYLILIILRKL